MMLARDIMTKEVITASMHDNLSHLGLLFFQNRISGIPIVDDENRVVGIITLSDLFRILSRLGEKMDLGRHLHRNSLKNIFREKMILEFMSAPVLMVKEDGDLSEIMKMILENKVHTIPVVDSSDFIVGIIGKRDIGKIFFG